jgi:hypothetical protein
MAELPKDEPTVDSAFLFVVLSPKMSKYRFQMSEATKMLKRLLKEAEESKVDPDWVKY